MIARIAALLAAAALLGACSSTTSGNGSAQRRASTSAAPTSTAATSSAPASTAPVSSSSAASTPAQSTHPVPATPLTTATVQGAHDTYVIKVWASVHSASCYDHAYGQPVITFLTKHPCTGLTRRLATTTINGRGVGMAVSSLGFVGRDPAVYSVAGNFTDLVTKDGTGNLDDLFRDGYRLPSGPQQVPSPDAFKALGQDAGVVVTDAWYLDGSTPTNDPALLTMIEETFLQY